MPVRFARTSADVSLGLLGGRKSSRPQPARSHFEQKAAGQTRLPTPQTSLWSSLTLRFGGFTANLEAMISPLCCGNINEAVARIFFREKIGDVVGLALRNPQAAVNIVRQCAANTVQPWGNLLRVACGDGEVLLHLLDSMDDLNSAGFADAAIEVARLRPLEGRLLLRHLFARAGNKDRLKIMAAFAETKGLDPRRNLGELFVQMMARSTPDERQREIYPGLLSIVSNPQMQNQPGLSFLRALFRGWLTEDEGAAPFLARI